MVVHSGKGIRAWALDVGWRLFWKYGAFFWKDMQEAECLVLGGTVAQRAAFGFILLASSPSPITYQLSLLG